MPTWTAATLVNPLMCTRIEAVATAMAGAVGGFVAASHSECDSCAPVPYTWTVDATDESDATVSVAI